jgi:hypothetical protein
MVLLLVVERRVAAGREVFVLVLAEIVESFVGGHAVIPG